MKNIHLPGEPGTNNKSAEPSAPGPGKPKADQEDQVDSDAHNILNPDAQNEILNAGDSLPAVDSAAAEKEKVYEEGTKNESLTEPEYNNSDDQPTFPDEEEGN
jgi:hypothetical protein